MAEGRNMVLTHPAVTNFKDDTAKVFEPTQVMHLPWYNTMPELTVAV